MSNDPSVQDEQKAVHDEEQVDSKSSTNADETTRSSMSEEEKLKAEHKERVFQGMIDSEFLAVTKGTKTLDQVHGAVKDEVKSLIEKQKSVKPEVTDEDKIANRIEEKLELRSVLSQIEPDQVEEAKADYEAFIQKGKSPEEAREKLRKLYEVKTKSEYEAFGQRSVRVGGSSSSKESDLARMIKNASAAEKKMLKAAGLIK